MSDLSDLLKQLSTEIPEALQHAVTVLTDIRAGVTLGADDPQFGPGDLHVQLLMNRRCMDRAETFVAQLGRLYARASVAEEDLKGVLEDAEATAIQEAGPPEDFSTAKERNARLLVRTFDERIALRKVSRQKAEIGEALEYARTLFRGMDATRRDTETRLRLMTLETGLER